jgi:molybdenum cofactor cytidylyltransferase
MTENKIIRVGGLLLAAGGSTRFGSPKQLARYEGKTLLRRSAEALTGAGCSTVVIVLGAHAIESQAEVQDLNIEVVVNDDWQTGMSSSIRTGLAKLLELDPEIDAVLITLMDQPLITATHLAAFIEKFRESSAPVTAAKYSGIAGVPALFSREMFDELFELHADRGARAIIRKREDVLTVNMEEAAVDINSLSDFENLSYS